MSWPPIRDNPDLQHAFSAVVPPFQQSLYKVHEVFAAARMYRDSTGTLPRGAEDICGRYPRWCSFDDPSRWTRDGWGREVALEVQDSQFSVRSAGGDGRLGTTDDLLLQSAVTAERVRSLAGCYRLSKDWWMLSQTEMIVLDSNAARESEYHVVPQKTGWRATWYPLPGEFVFIGWSLPPGGYASLWLVQSGDSLVGEGHVWSDASIADRTSRLNATKVPCAVDQQPS